MSGREHPVLVKGDGDIAEYRRWVAQFYSWPDEPADNEPRPNGSNGRSRGEPSASLGAVETQGKVNTNG